MNRDEARLKAESYLTALRERGEFPEATGVREILRVDELSARRPPLYGIRLEQCWIAYLARPPRGLFSSTILVIDDATGDLVYSGSAHDEG